MNTEEIDRILRYRVREFDGVFSVDTLPDNPRLLVCNKDASDKPGRHWICMHFEAGRGEHRFVRAATYCEFRTIFEQTLFVMDV